MNRRWMNNAAVTHMKSSVARFAYPISVVLLIMGGTHYFSPCSFYEVLLYVNFGSTPEGTASLHYLIYVYVYIGMSVYLYAQVRTDFFELGMYRMIRHQNVYKFGSDVLRKYSSQIVSCLSILFFVTACTTVLFRLPIQTDLATLYVTVSFFVFGFLQMFFYVLLLIVLTFLLADHYKPVLILFGMTLLALLGLNKTFCFPFLLNSMGLIRVPTFIYPLLLSLISANMMVLIVYFVLLGRKDFYIDGS